MEIQTISIILNVLFFALLVWLGTSRHLMSEDLKMAEKEKKRLNDVISSRKADSEDDEDDEEEYPEIKIGSDVEILLGEFRVHGKIESVAGTTGKTIQTGFVFRAYGDKDAIWIKYNDPSLVLLEDEEEDTKTEEPKAATAEEKPVETTASDILGIRPGVMFPNG